jgi:hypothetical protein
MYKTLLIPIILLFSSCSSKSEKSIPLKNSKSKAGLEKDTSINQAETKIKLLSIDSNYIKENFSLKGRLKEYIKWEDAEGTHVVFTNETGVYRTETNNEEEGYKQNAEVFCAHYLKTTTGFSKKWSIYDYYKNCPVDASAEFCDKSLEVTDLNNNSIPEIWVAYRIACRGDVSPSDLKLQMYEGDKKYKMQGFSRIELKEEERYGGEITFFKNFNNEKVFLDYAKKKWALVKMEGFY